MTLFKEIRSIFSRPRRDVEATTRTEQHSSEPVSEPHPEIDVAKPYDEETISEAIGEDDQHGVQTVEATTMSWTRASLVTVFILLVNKEDMRQLFPG